MPGSKQEGFVKSANKEKFVRNRDIKLKSNEVARENNIARLMCEGVCNKCREKVQWRFRYSKYKPLTKIATCQTCKQKCVTKAYRTMCDKCATSKKQCSSCCEDMETANLQYNRDAAEKVAKGATESNDKAGEGDEDEEDEDDDEEEDEGEKDRGENNKHDETDRIQEKTEVRSVAESSASIAPSSSSSTTSVPIVPTIGFGEVDDRKFAQTVASKYSKDRKVGTADDTHVFQFGETSSTTKSI